MGDTKNIGQDGIPISESFQQRLKLYNNLGKLGFKEWAFHPAMLFRSDYKWWGDLGKRERPHEGLDFCVYRTKEGDIRYVDEKFEVPVVFKGQVVTVIDDFLGNSVFVSHDAFDIEGRQLHTLYGHIKPSQRTHTGKRLGETDIIGTIADAKKTRRAIHSHLHISVVLVATSVPTKELSWQTINNPTKVVLLDPLRVIEIKYSMVTSI